MTNIIKKDGRPATFGTVVDQLFHQNLHRFFDDELWGLNGPQNRNQVPVNIRETGKSYELELIAPGLQKQDFHLQFSGDTLTVSFEIKEENNTADENDRWLRKEYRKQSFTRSFNIDETVDTENTAARYENGILYLTLPKKAQAQKISRTINIQ